MWESLLDSGSMMEGMGSMEGSSMLTKSNMMQDILKDPEFMNYVMQQTGMKQPPILTKGWKTRRTTF